MEINNVKDLNDTVVEVTKVAKKRNLGRFLKDNWVSVAVLIYVLSPIDVLPDQIPFIGTLDDAGLLFAELVRRFVKGE